MADTKPTEFSVNLVASDRPVYAGQARYAVIPDPFGAMAFLPGHEPILCTLQKGVVRIDSPDGTRRQFDIDTGFASFDSDKLTIAVGHAKEHGAGASAGAPSAAKQNADK
jgi:F-type H+-transporting ATPase subunit epsilon